MLDEDGSCARQRARLVAELRENRDIIVSALSALEDGVVDVCSPDGAFYVFFDVRRLVERSAQIGNADDFCRVLLEKHMVALVPGQCLFCVCFEFLD